MIKWTNEDQVALNELQRRQKAWLECSVNPLSTFIDQRWPFREHTKQYAAPTLLTFLMNNADALRDLLAPFDSGKRPPKAGTENKS